MASSQYTVTSQSRLQEYGWRTFCFEFLYGIVVIMWYLLALAEMAIFKVLTRLGKSAALASSEVAPHRN